jgi:transposase
MSGASGQIDATLLVLREENGSLREQVAAQRQTIASLERTLAERERTIAQLQEQVVQLQRQIEQLRQQIDELRKTGKRQAAPFRKQEEPISRPKKPGRKRGRRHGPHLHRSPPPRIDEHYEAPLPETCPHCGSHNVHETHVAPQYQTEIPRRVIYRQFHVHFGRCEHCRHAIAGRHPLQTSRVIGAAGSQFGPSVHAVLAVLNKQLGLSHGKSAQLLAALFDDLHVSRATSARSIERTARRAEPAYVQVRQNVRDAAEVAPDETGWRVGGRSAWLHALVSPRATCYVIDPTRSSAPAQQVLGSDWSGTLVHDGWSVYDGFESAAHQQCLAHLQRRCRELAEAAKRGAVRFPRAVLELIDAAFAARRLWRGHRLSGDELVDHGLALSCELERLTSGHFTDSANRRLAKHLAKHPLAWFWFLMEPGVQATNHWAERAIRPAVVNRKVWGGNRTWIGAHAQSVLMSVIRTCGQRTFQPFAFLTTLLCQPHPQLIPP